MICSCLAADGERSKRGNADTGVGVDTGSEPRCDWPEPSRGRASGQLLSGLLAAGAWPAGLGAAAMGCSTEVCRCGGGGAVLWPFGECSLGLNGTAWTGE